MTLYCCVKMLPLGNWHNGLSVYYFLQLHVNLFSQIKNFNEEFFIRKSSLNKMNKAFIFNYFKYPCLIVLVIRIRQGSSIYSIPASHIYRSDAGKLVT